MKKKKGSYHHKNLREALLKLTTEIIANEGQETVTLRELARRIGVSRTAPYRHFKDKNSLLAAVAVACFQDLNLNLLNDFDAPHLDALEQLHRMLCHYVTFAIDHHFQYRLMFGKGFHENEIFPELSEVADETFAILAQAVAQCQDRGLVNEGDPRHFGYMIWSSVHGLSVLYMDGKLQLGGDPSAFIWFACRGFIDGIKKRTGPVGQGHT